MLRHRNDQLLNTPITGMTPKALAMESTRLATLAEHDRLEWLQMELDKRERHQLVPVGTNTGSTRVTNLVSIKSSVLHFKI